MVTNSNGTIIKVSLTCQCQLTSQKCLRNIITRHLLDYRKHRINGLPPVYGQKRQYAKSLPDLSTLLKHLITEIQQKIGSLLYYARALDYTMLPSLSDISTTQAKPTTNTAKKVDWLFDYCATYPLVKMRFHASDMILHVESDAAYLIALGAKSRIAGYYYLSNKDGTLDNPPFYVLCQLLRHVVASAAESETAGTFFNAR